GRCALTVVPMEGWRRRMLFPDTGLPWVLPSPNMPTFDTAVVYPGQVLLEGTNLSEGRGATRPFEIFGAPWVELRKIHRRFARRRTAGPGARLARRDGGVPQGGAAGAALSLKTRAAACTELGGRLLLSCVRPSPMVRADAPDVAGAQSPR